MAELSQGAHLCSHDEVFNSPAALAVGWRCRRGRRHDDGRTVPAGRRARPAEGPWAIELFTSQGCSSCPPADAYLGKLAKRPDIVALSFHVDYWDYIGWKDPFATRETTERQRAYARVLKQRYVYTPEMVVDGIGHDTGRERGPIERLLANAQRGSPQRATPELSRTIGGPLTIKLAAFPLDGRPADVTLASTTGATRRRWRAARTRAACSTTSTSCAISRCWAAGTARRRAGPSAADRVQPGQGVAVIVQHADHGPVMGCNKLEPMVSG